MTFSKGADYTERIAETAEKFGCKFYYNESLKKYNTFRIGGNCRLLVKINSVESCIAVRKECKENNIPYVVIGNGSNLIIDDNGFNGVVILIGNDFSEISSLSETEIYCQSGALLSSFCVFARENSLSGAEFAYGIPGSVGGAVYMNAGAYGGEIKDIISYCDVIDENNEVKRLTPYELGLSYRHSSIMGTEKIIVGAAFSLKKGDKSEIKSAMDDFMNRRKTKQPLEYGSAGSTFKRPEGSYASLLIDECGLKGYSVGGAQVSEKHAGFVINKDNATFSDVMSVIEDVRRIVKEKTGYVLECEPVIISDKI
ncbi:MAG: UDP-N-acetylmuramate dehydrogenase [Oscillospiraceae bacterium]|nr:UDP-N-acetylmuramate dehydrogenase [Oscillospiraceae bacterium]